MDVTVDKPSISKRSAKLNIQALHDKTIAQNFSRRVVAIHQTTLQNDNELNPEAINQNLQAAFRTASVELLQTTYAKAKRPWISEATLSFIDKRNKARQNGEWNNKKELTKYIKSSAKNNRSNWLRSIAGTKDWTIIRKLRKPVRADQGRLRDLQGNLVFSDKRAETMATYLDKVQWRVRPDAIVSSRPPVWQKLDVKLGKIESLEVKRVVDKMKKNKVSDVDEIPAECLKTLVSTDNSLTIFVDLCEPCWSSKKVPSKW